MSIELVMTLLGFSEAYPEDQFPPLTKAEIAELPAGVLDRASAAMGRHLAKFAKQAADEIEEQHKEIERLRAKLKRIHSASLTWAMVCQCGCTECASLYEMIRSLDLVGLGDDVPAEPKCICAPIGDGTVANPYCPAHPTRT